MKNILFSSLFFFVISILNANNDEIFENFSSKYVNSSIKKSSLLVVKYKKLDIDNPVFCQWKMDKNELLKFINEENLLVHNLNL